MNFGQAVPLQGLVMAMPGQHHGQHHRQILAGVEQDLRLPAFLSGLAHSMSTISQAPCWPIFSPISPFCRGPGRKLHFSVLFCKMGPDKPFPLAPVREVIQELSKLTIAYHTVLDRWGSQYHNWWPTLWCDQKSPVPTHARLYPQPGWRDEGGGRVPESLLLRVCLYRPYCSASLSHKKGHQVQRGLAAKTKSHSNSLTSQRGCFSKE